MFLRRQECGNFTTLISYCSLVGLNSGVCRDGLQREDPCIKNATGPNHVKSAESRPVMGLILKLFLPVASTIKWAQRQTISSVLIRQTPCGLQLCTPSLEGEETFIVSLEMIFYFKKENGSGLETIVSMTVSVSSHALCTTVLGFKLHITARFGLASSLQNDAVSL